MVDIQYKTPQDVAIRLDVSPSTLRRWSDEFAEFLSTEASSPPGNSHRRYTEQDIERLLMVRDHMNNGMTYEQVRQQLREAFEVPITRALITNESAAEAMIDYVSDTIDNLRQGQLSVLNSQAANRELMGVVIQDNFNLKEENNRLRERMLELERQMGQMNREESSRRETMRQEFEMKLAEIRETVTQNSSVTVLQSRSGCLGGLFGGGRVETITNPNSPSSASGSAPHPPSPSPYPRPPGPPE